MPAVYRQRLLEAGDGQVVLTVDRDRCLLLYPLNAWEEIERKLIQLSSTNKRARALKRLLLGHAEECRLDAGGRIHQALFVQFSGPIRTLIDNKYVYQPYWTAQQNWDRNESWREGFEASRKVALRALMDKDTVRVLSIVFDRLYVLRNQLVHGGATWNGAVNRQQVRDGVAFLGTLLPLLLELMIAHPGEDHGEILYPVVA